MSWGLPLQMRKWWWVEAVQLAQCPSSRTQWSGKFRLCVWCSWLCYGRLPWIILGCTPLSSSPKITLSVSSRGRQWSAGPVSWPWGRCAVLDRRSSMHWGLWCWATFSCLLRSLNYNCTKRSEWLPGKPRPTLILLCSFSVLAVLYSPVSILDIIATPFSYIPMIFQEIDRI